MCQSKTSHPSWTNSFGSPCVAYVPELITMWLFCSKIHQVWKGGLLLKGFEKNYFIKVKNRICPLGMNFAFPKTWPWPLVNLDWGHVFHFLIFLVSMQIRFFTWASFGLMANLEKTQNWIFCNFSTNLCYVPSWNMHSYQVSLLPTHGSDTFESQFP